MMKTAKKSTTITILIIFISFIIFPSVSATEWGENDRKWIQSHGITHHGATYLPSANIEIDGIANESVWNDPAIYNYNVHLQNSLNSQSFFTVSLQIKYVYDNTNLYIRAIWNDNSFDRWDMFYICWDINCENYSVLFLLDEDVMKTPTEGETVDSWGWMCNNLPNGTIKNMRDNSFNHEGWNDDDFSDPNCAYTYNENSSDSQQHYYLLELKRSLTTNEDLFDTQFHHNQTYRFSLGTADGYGNEEHAISWDYDLTLKNTSIIPSKTITSQNTKNTNISIVSYQSSWLIGLSGISITLIILKLAIRKKKFMKN